MKTEDEVLDDLLTGEDIEFTTYPIRIDRYDKHLTDQMREASDRWRDVEKERTEEFEKTPELMDTIFNGLFQAAPIPTPDEQLTKSGKTLRDLTNALMETKEWRQLRYDTRHDEVASAIATSILTKGVLLPEQPKDKESEDSAEQDPTEPGEQQGEGGQGKGDGSLSDEEMDRIRQAARGLLTKAAEEVEEHKGMEGLLWGSDVDSKKGGDARTRLQFAKQLKANPRLKTLAELLGRFRFVAEQKFRRRVNHGRDELTDVVLGDSLADMIPEEFIKLAIPEMEIIFLLDLSQRNLMQYQFEATDKVGRGPIIALIDMSGSMSYKLSGGEYYNMQATAPMKLDWALATALALSVFAKKEKRDLHIGLFNGGLVKTWFFPKGAWEPKDIFEIGAYMPSGGTQFAPPLQYGMDRISENEHSKADIVLITDGISDVTPQFMQEYRRVKAEKQFKTLGVLLHHGSMGVLESLCDDTIGISDLKEGAKALDKVFAL